MSKDSMAAALRQKMEERLPNFAPAVQICVTLQLAWLPMSP